MTSKIKIYKNNPTEGDTDGTLVSSNDLPAPDPIESGAIKVPTLPTEYQEGDPIKLALRCDDGYVTVLDGGVYATITMEDSDHKDKWALSLDNIDWEDFGDQLTFDSEIGDLNVIFWAKARVKHDEEPSNDESVDIQVAAVIGAE